ncbi:MAG: radical SAM protein [Deltaproteobacteria bacterium]|nr:MAG: radical SAM protein [Deltaproteobacteria bacterium]
MPRKYRYIFGPVPSRRFGRSLGVDLLPLKTCSLDCVFCQLGRTREKSIERKEYVSTQEVIHELRQWLESGVETDVITLSGSGEPTLHSRFGEVLEYIRSNSSTPLVLLTNGTMLHLPEVRKSAALASIVKVSLSAWDQASYGWVNRPHDKLAFDKLVEGEVRFREEFEGQLFLEVFLVKGINSLPDDVKKIAAFARQIRPDRVQLNTAVRPPAESFVEPLSRQELEDLAKLFDPPAEIIAEFGGKRARYMKANEEAILSMLRRRPCTAEEISEVFDMNLNEVSKYLTKLLNEGLIKPERRELLVYYRASSGQK